MTENLRQRATQFAEALQATPSVRAYHAAQTELENDAATQFLLLRLQARRAEYQRKQSNGTLTEADIAAVRQLQHEVRSAPRVVAFGAAQQAMFDFVQQVSARLSEALGVDFGALAAPPRSGCCG